MTIQRQYFHEIAKAGWNQHKPRVFFSHLRKVKDELNKMPTFAEMLEQEMNQVDRKYSPEEVNKAVEKWKERCYQQRPNKVPC